jgi:hypothetical protein
MFSWLKNARAESVVSGSKESNIELAREQLSSIEDLDYWNQSHKQLIIEYNKYSILFWVLSAASLCFSTLNAYHGFTTSGAFSVGMASFVIGFLYFVIEFTVPVSAHLMSWGSRGESRWTVRGLGIIAYTLGVVFSLLILQGKFSSGADTASAQSEGKAIVFSADKDGLLRAQEIVKSLSARVAGRSPESILAEMNSILATRTSGGLTLAEATTNCTGERKLSKQRSLCAQYDGLVRLREDALTVREANAKIDKLTDNLTDTTRVTTKSSDVQDRVISAVSGVPLENIQLFKSSIIAIMAALLTHMLWAAHGLTVNLAISKKRDQHFAKSRLRRVVANAERDAATFVRQTEAQFMISRGTPERVARAVSMAPLREQPVATQIQTYFNNCAIIGDEFSMQAGIFHDHYCAWSRNEGVIPVSVDRFVAIVKDLQFGISQDGKIIGAAIKG